MAKTTAAAVKESPGKISTAESIGKGTEAIAPWRSRKSTADSVPGVGPTAESRGRDTEAASPWRSRGTTAESVGGLHGRTGGGNVWPLVAAPMAMSCARKLLARRGVLRLEALLGQWG